MLGMKHIAIAGAGPAGAATALLLAQRGIKVTLIEKEATFDRAFRGEGLMPAGLAALYDMGLKEIFDQIATRRLDAWDFYVGARRRMRVREPEKAGIATQIIDQGSLLKAIVQKAQALPNFEFYPGWQIIALLREENSQESTGQGGRAVKGVRATCQGQSRDFLADAVIACDGRYSPLRKLAGLALVRSPSQFDVLWFKLPAPPALATETSFIACLQPHRQFAFYPSWDGRLQIGWIIEKHSSDQPSPRLAELKNRDWIEDFAQALPPELAAHFRQHKSELEGPIYLDVQVGLCPQWSLPGMLLLGDAAHPMAPNRAQGINMALRDAIVAVNHLVSDWAKSPAGTVPHAIFQAIQAERQPEIEAVQKMQLDEWRKVAFLSQPGLPYWGFKSAITAFGRFSFAQNIWLHEQKGLREGVLSVRIRV
jgi:2-polyprenyl-6-methoxyphenol hydroxylase-like FAD-dependent oxidoreductase